VIDLAVVRNGADEPLEHDSMRGVRPSLRLVVYGAVPGSHPASDPDPASRFGVDHDARRKLLGEVERRVRHIVKQ